MADAERTLRAAYAAFNARDIEAAVAQMHPEVDWPNAWEGGRVRGREAVREYWRRQFESISGKVDPEAFAAEPDGSVTVTVHQVVHEADGGALVSDSVVRHRYRLEGGLIVRGEVLDAGAADPPALARALLAATREAAGSGDRHRLEGLAAELRDVDPLAIEGDEARLAFWIDLYNALLLDRIGRRPIRGSVLRQARLFSRTACEVGGHRYSLDQIEHGVLRRNSRPPYRLRRSFRSADPRHGAAPSRLDPRIHFALNCGARSCPPIRDYAPAEVDAQLEAATRDYLRAETAVDEGRRRVALPRLMRLYGADFGDRAAQLELAARHLPEVAALLDDGDGSRVHVAYGRFDWTAAQTASGPSSPVVR